MDPVTYVRNTVVPSDIEGLIQYLCAELDKVSYTLTEMEAAINERLEALEP